jgi:hypothetical protein
MRTACLVLVALALWSRPARAEIGVDLALVLAADCSFSVTAEEYQLQQQGYARAFRDKRVLNAILANPGQAIAVTYFQWSGPALQAQLIPWMVIRGQRDAEIFAAALEAVPRRIFRGGTSISGAIDFSTRLLGEDAATDASRRVIDVSGDGRNNIGRPAEVARDEAVARGIVINGLPIHNDEPDIAQYYQRSVIGGPGAFMIEADNFEAFGEAILAKLLQEIAAVEPRPRPDRMAVLP